MLNVGRVKVLTEVVRRGSFSAAAEALSYTQSAVSQRIGFAIRYIPTYVRQVAGSHDTATLVRGVDRHGNFEPEQRPDADCSPAALACHAAVTGAHAQILMRDSGREMRA